MRPECFPICIVCIIAALHADQAMNVGYALAKAYLEKGLDLEDMVRAWTAFLEAVEEGSISFQVWPGRDGIRAILRERDLGNFARCFNACTHLLIRPHATKTTWRQSKILT